MYLAFIAILTQYKYNTVAILCSNKIKNIYYQNNVHKIEQETLIGHQSIIGCKIDEFSIFYFILYSILNNIGYNLYVMSQVLLYVYYKWWWCYIASFHFYEYPKLIIYMEFRLWLLFMTFLVRNCIIYGGDSVYFFLYLWLQDIQ